MFLVIIFIYSGTIDIFYIYIYPFFVCTSVIDASTPLPGTYLKMNASLVECQTVAEYVHFVSTPIVRHDYESGTLETPKTTLETRYLDFFRSLSTYRLFAYMLFQ